MATAGSTGSINLVTKASPKVMERFKLASVTEGLFNHDYNWTGVSTVTIHSIDTVPLNDYNAERVDGGSRYGNLINLGDTVQEHTVKEKKSFMFAIDETYNTQQLQIKRASQCLKREVDEKVIPYIDKYRLNKMAAAATTANKNIASETLTTSNIIETIMGANAAMNENLVPEGGRVCYISHKRAMTLNLAQQVVGTGYPVEKGSIGEKSIVNGELGVVDGVHIKRVPSGYLPNDVEFMIVKKGICFAPTQLKDYSIHPGAHVLQGSIATGLVQHDCFVPEGREKCIFVVKASGSDEMVIVSDGSITLSASTASVVKGNTTEITATLTGAELTNVVSSDETVATARILGDTIVISGVAAGSATITIVSHGTSGYTSPEAKTVTVTVTNS